MELHCGKTFRTRGHLEAHSTVHTKFKRFRCKICDKTFSHEISLKRHVLIHSGEKPFQCHLCKKRFNQKGNLKTHYRNIHVRYFK